MKTMNKFRDDYLEENENFYTNLISALEMLSSYKKELKKFKIDIEEKPWYKNILKIHVPNAIEFYKRCKCPDFDFEAENDKWIRSDFKSFMSEVEKFTKFVAKTILKIDDNMGFNESINKLDIIIQKYQVLFDEKLKWVECIEEIKNNLHIWRQNYNENKHDEEKIDDNFFVSKRTGYVLGDSVLEYVPVFLYHVVVPLLSTLLTILLSDHHI